MIRGLGVKRRADVTCSRKPGTGALGSSFRWNDGFGWVAATYLPVVPVKTGTQRLGLPVQRTRYIGFHVGRTVATTDCTALGSSFRWNDGFGWVAATYLPVVPMKTETTASGGLPSPTYPSFLWKPKRRLRVGCRHLPTRRSC